VSYKFTVRKGCNVRVASTSGDQIDVLIFMDSTQYAPPDLQPRAECVYDPDHLDKLSSGAGIQILGLKAITIALAALLPWGGLGLATYVKFILGRGIKTDTYAALPEIEILDTAGAVIDALASAIPAGQGIVVDDAQHYPAYGWIDAKWTSRSPAGGGASAAVQGRELEDARM
jgi:hypothetical protein